LFSTCVPICDHLVRPQRKIVEVGGNVTVNHTQRICIGGIYTRFLIDVLGNSFNVSSVVKYTCTCRVRSQSTLLGGISHPERARRRHDQGTPSPFTHTGIPAGREDGDPPIMTGAGRPGLQCEPTSSFGDWHTLIEGTVRFFWLPRSEF